MYIFVKRFSHTPLNYSFQPKENNIGIVHEIIPFHHMNHRPKAHKAQNFHHKYFYKLYNQLIKYNNTFFYGIVLFMVCGNI